MSAVTITRHKSLASALFERSISDLQNHTNRVFTFLLIGQWVAAVLCAFFLSPLTWSGPDASTHVHLVAAVVVGGLLTCFPVWLIRTRPADTMTRIVVASAQTLFSALLIHLMGGRIEAHFHIFGSLALLSFYRDSRVFVPAVGLTFVDHVFRGVFWPESVFGVSSPEIGRAFEHAGWVLFETAFLLWGVAQSRQHLRRMADLQASLESDRDDLEERVAQRTIEHAQALDYLENTLNSLDAHIGILDLQGNVLTTNKAWREHGPSEGGGLERSDIGENYLKVCESVTGPGRKSAWELASAIRAVLDGAGELHVVEYACHEPDGDRWYQARVSPFIGGKDAAVVISHVDITDRVAATQASLDEATRSQALAEVITESPNELYIFSRGNLQIELVNEGAVRATGYSREEFMEMTPSSLLSSEGLTVFQEKIDFLADKQRAVVEFATEHRCNDGQTRPVRVSLHTSYYNGMPVYVAFVTDLTEIRQLEESLARSQKLESIWQLAAGIAHEINTPMQCVSNNVDFLRSCQESLYHVVDEMLLLFDKPSKSWEERKEEVERLINEARYARLTSQGPAALDEAAEASHRVVEIVRAMKVMSHPGTHDKSATDINEVIRSATTISRNRWKYAAELDLTLDGSLPLVPALASEMSQVFLNLVVNAADAIAEKNGEDGDLGLIKVRSLRADDHVRIEIEDNGTGIPEAIRAKLFDPFFTTKGVGKGTGQGLSITHDVVVNLHGGTIDLLSTEGKGTTFVVCLPLETPEFDQEADPSFEDEEMEQGVLAS